MNFNNKAGIKDKEMVPIVGKNIAFYKYSNEKLLRIITRDHVDCIFSFE